MNEQANLVVLGNDYHDGFSDPDDDGRHSIIRGTMLKFTNTAQWITRAGDQIEPEREFLAVQVERAEQKFLDHRLVEIRILKPDEKPRVAELNAAAPKEEWREHFGQQVGPWQFCYALYLLCPVTMAAYTYPASTVGGFQAVRTLKDETRRARLLRGDNFFPIVSLGDVHMPTAFGGRPRPAFIVKKFVPIGPSPERAPTIAAPEPGAKTPKPKRGDSDAEMNDAIPW